MVSIPGYLHHIAMPRGKTYHEVCNRFSERFRDGCAIVYFDTMSTLAKAAIRRYRAFPVLRYLRSGPYQFPQIHRFTFALQDGQRTQVLHVS